MCYRVLCKKPLKTAIMQGMETAETPFILSENEKDLARMDKNDPKYDRLKLTEERLLSLIHIEMCIRDRFYLWICMFHCLSFLYLAAKIILFSLFR